MNRFEVIGVDADDTLWRSEDGFHRAEARFCELVEPHADGADVRAALTAAEQRFLPISGYGVKAFTISMLACAAEVTAGRLPGTVTTDLVNLGVELLTAPVELMPGVESALAEMAADGYRLALITKGDLIHQQRKIDESSLAKHFSSIDIVIEKDETTYRAVLGRLDTPPERFCMVGNSLVSDVLPVRAIGGAGVHVPYHLTWAHEHADHDGDVPTLDTLAELPELLRRWKD